MSDLRLPEWLPSPLRSAATNRNLQAREAVFYAGDQVHTIYWMRRGGVRLTRSDLGGLDVALQFHGAGEFVAEGSVFSESYHCDGNAVTAATVSQLPKALFVECLERDPVFNRHWLSHVTSVLRDARSKLACLQLKTASERILFSLSVQARTGDHVLPQPLLHWARELGLTHETLYRALSRMEKAGLIVRNGRRIQVLDGGDRKPAVSDQ